MRTKLLCLTCFIALAYLPAPVEAQARETIIATARVRSAGGISATAPLTVIVERFSTDAERDALLAALKQGGTASARDLLASRGELGSVQMGTRRTAIKYAYARDTAAGRLITVITGSPILFLGAGLPDAPPKAGFDLGLVMLETVRSGSGTGELVPATKIRVDDQGAIVTDDYSEEVVRLSNVIGK